MFSLAALCAQISPADPECAGQIQQTIDNKTKPLGSLGQLEALALQLGKIQYAREGHSETLAPINPAIAVFAGDHGIAAHPISIAPQAVTQQMVMNFIHQGAAINCFCRANDIALTVVDCGMQAAVDVSSSDDFIVSRIAAGTEDFTVDSAMSLNQLNRALESGGNIAQSILDTGVNALGFGEMGIGNTSSASAILAALLNREAVDTVGVGTGINQQQLAQKRCLVQQGLDRVAKLPELSLSDPVVALQQFGGFEIAHIVGAMLATARARKVILVDGFIVSVAAAICVKLAPACRGYMVFCHASAEAAHQLVMRELKAIPLLNLDMRLGEGTGCALAVPLLRAAVSFYNDMATFESAQVVL